MSGDDALFILLLCVFLGICSCGFVLCAMSLKANDDGENAQEGGKAQLENVTYGDVGGTAEIGGVTFTREEIDGMPWLQVLPWEDDDDTPYGEFAPQGWRWEPDCVTCGRPDAPVREDGRRYCSMCWTVWNG